jgi:hypothetical protein
MSKGAAEGFGVQIDLLGISPDFEDRLGDLHHVRRAARGAPLGTKLEHDPRA